MIMIYICSLRFPLNTHILLVQFLKHDGSLIGLTSIEDNHAWILAQV